MTTLGVVLAGGSSSRFGADKAAAMLGGKTLLAHVCARAAPQVDRLVVNRKGEPFPGYECLPDNWPDEGPLAGIVAALEYAGAHGFAHVASFPCDTPFFPADLVKRLRAQLIRDNADYCMARCAGREQRVLALWNASSAAALKARFLAGLRSLGDVPGVLTATIADFPAAETGCFSNINTADDLADAARQLVSHAEYHHV